MNSLIFTIESLVNTLFTIEGGKKLAAEDGAHAREREGEDEVARREDLDDLRALAQEGELQLRNLLPGGALRLSGVTLSRERCQAVA